MSASNESERQTGPLPSGYTVADVARRYRVGEDKVRELIKTIYEAMVLVVIVVLLFLQGWRPAIIPIAAIPVSLVGTFAAMAALGYGINNLTLFGLLRWASWSTTPLSWSKMSSGISRAA